MNVSNLTLLATFYSLRRSLLEVQQLAKEFKPGVQTMRQIIFGVLLVFLLMWFWDGKPIENQPSGNYQQRVSL